MVWRARIKGDKLEIQRLSRELVDQDTTIIEDNNNFYLLTPKYDTLKNASQVREVADGILGHIHGFQRLRHNDSYPLRTSAVEKIYPDGRKDITVSVEPLRVKATLNARGIVIDSNGNIKKETPFLSKALVVASRCPNLRKILVILSKSELNWTSLFNIIEIVRADMQGSKTLFEKGWISKNLLERIERTANCPETGGSDARHAKSTAQPPKNPITLKDARNTITNLLNSWIAFKVEEMYEPEKKVSFHQDNEFEYLTKSQ